MKKGTLILILFLSLSAGKAAGQECALTSGTADQNICVDVAITDIVYSLAGATGATVTGLPDGVNYSFATPDVTISGIPTASGPYPYTVTMTGGGGCISTGTITVDPLPGAAGDITGTATVCQGQSSVSYSVAAITDATGYSWSYSGTGATIVGSTEAITINFSASATGGNLTVHGTNSCGSGTTSTPYAITVNPLPGAAGDITGTASVCKGQSGVSYSVAAITNATGYSWSYSGTGATIVGSTEAITINFSASATSGNLTVYGTNTCGSGTTSTPYAITVNPLPVPAITGPDRACITSTGNLYTTASGMSGYDWDVSSDGTITGGGGATNNTVTVTWDDSGAETVRVNYIDGNGCIAASQTIYPVTVIEKPLPTDVQFSGVLREFATLTASYNYAPDVCFPEVPAETEISWYRADNSGGGSSHLIATKPGTDKTLVLSDNEDGKYIRVKVKLSDGATLMTGVFSTGWLGPVAANEKPEALGVSISGTLKVNNILDGLYTYSDDESDPEGATAFQWFRANDGSGSGSVSISGATSQTYTLTTSDRNKYIRFRVTPKAQTGTTPGDAVYTAWAGPITDNPPVASNVTISGSIRVSSVLNGNYQYSDTEGDAEGSSILKWYTGTSSSGAGSDDIDGATSASYLLTNNEIGKFIGFSVTPVAQQGTSPGGIVTTTTWVGPVFNDPPIATILPVTGSLNVNGLLTGHYVYTDTEGDIESGTSFQWYSSDSEFGTYSTVDGETGIAHVITNDEQGKYFKLYITPKTATGGPITAGTEVKSPAYGPANSQPTASSVAIISGEAKVGSTLTGDYIFDDVDPADLEGTSIFRWLRDGTIPISGATGTSYLVTPEDEGYYISFEVTPVSLTGYPNTGTPVQSTPTTDIIDPSLLTPLAEQVCIEGIRADGQVLRGKYYYNFYKSEGTSTYQWYRNGSPIDGATGIQYTLQQVADINSNADITFEVTPKSSNIPAKVGTSIESNPLSRIIMPKDQYSVSESDVVLSANVMGGVFSGTGVTGEIFSPKTAGSAGSPYTISYLLNIVNTAHNCSQQASKLVAVNPNISSFVGFDPLYCHDSGPDVITVTGVPTGSTIIGFTLTDNNGIVSQSGTTVTIDPGRMRPGVNKDILYFSYNYLGTFYQISQTFKIDSVGTEIRILNLDPAYCQSDPKEYISVEGVYPLGGTATWTGDILSDTKAGSAYADPSLGTPGSTYPVSYQYRSPSGCYSEILNDSVTINPLPNPSFALNPTYNIGGGPITLIPVQTGGTFSGNGVSGDKMFPDIAGLGEHEIKYSITDANGCSANLGLKTRIRVAQGKFIDIPSVICYEDTTYNVKITDLPVPMSGVQITGFTNHKNTLVYTLGATSADYNVPAVGEGLDTLVFTYKWDGVAYSISKAINVDSLGQAVIKNLTSGDLICDNMAPYELFPSITGGVFTGPVSGSYLDPTKALGPAVVTYTYTNIKTGCSTSTVVPVTIYPAPKVAFAPADVCIENNADTTFFINNSTSSDTIQSWLWEFTDAGGIKTSDEKDAGYLYSTGGLQKIALTATTVNNCSASKEATFNLGIRPDADFYWRSDCMHPNDSIILRDTTKSSSLIVSRSWKLFNGAEFSTAEKEARYPKSDTGYIKIEYIVRTSYANCIDTVIKDIYIKPAVTVPADGYFENFEAGKGGWVKGEITGNTWSFGQPDGQEINSASSGHNAWFTKINIAAPAKESSSIVSPCFDFRTTERPLINLKLWRRFTRDSDGAVLQYKIGDSNEWQSVGAIDDGIEWYNSAVIRGVPGGSQMGWTTRGTPDESWVEAIHTLDGLKGKSDVIFRIAYGSDGSSLDDEGLAFDDIWIGERSRIILLEHFTNISDISSSNANALVDTIVKYKNKDVINIQYHTNFPGADPYYDANPGDASARILFYGLIKAPYTFIDGGTKKDFAYMYDNDIAKIDSNDVTKRSLIPSRFNISLTTEVFGGVLIVNGRITALENISSDNLTLFIAVTEKENSDHTGVNGEEVFYNVFRKFIPDAGGMNLKNTWTKGETYTLPEQTWLIEKISNSSDIEVIVFIQNNITKELYQAASEIKQEVTVGIEDLFGDKGNDFALYPNPAVKYLTISFKEPLSHEAEVRIYDIRGVVNSSYKTGSGISDFIIDDLNLKGGIYLVRITAGGVDLGFRKLIVSGD